LAISAWVLISHNLLSAQSGPVISTATLAEATVAVAYSQSLTAVGGTTPYTWAVTSGSLPPGLALGASSGLISGTPTSPDTLDHNFPLTVKVTDASGKYATQTSWIFLRYGGPVIGTATLAEATVAVAYSQSLTASGGTTPYTWGKRLSNRTLFTRPLQ